MNKIVFDLSFVVSTNVNSGVAKYGYRFLDYIVKSNHYNEFVLLLNESTACEIKKMYPQFESRIIGQKWFKYTRFLRFFFYMLSFKIAVRKIKSELIFCPYGNIINCLSTQQKKISVIHDLQVQIDKKIRKKRYYWLHKFAEDRLMVNSLFIFTISNFSKRQIISLYPSVENKILNMSNSVSMIKTNDLKPMTPGYRYLLYCGRLFVQKNVMTLVKAYNLLHQDYPNLNLVLIASEGKYWNDEIKPFAEEHNFLERIILTGRCSEEELSRWYLGASCFVFPSVREGFGSPPIEAAYMHVPVVTSKADSLEEVTLGLLNYYEPPTNEKELAIAIKKILDNPPSDEHLCSICNEFEKHYSIDVVGRNIYEFLNIYNHC